jgi:hypothetical protein
MVERGPEKAGVGGSIPSLGISLSINGGGALAVLEPEQRDGFCGADVAGIGIQAILQAQRSRGDFAFCLVRLTHLPYQCYLRRHSITKAIANASASAMVSQNPNSKTSNRTGSPN